MNLSDYAVKILDWAHERGLDTPENIDKQELKLVEELGELAEGINKNRPEQVKDSIGDAFVVFVILFKKANPDFRTSYINEAEFNEYQRIYKPNTNSLEKSKMWATKKVLEFMNYEMSYWATIDDIYDGASMLPIDEFNRRVLYNSFLRLHDAIKILAFTGIHFKLNLIDCVAEAYNTIKDRKGKTVDGVFIKEGD